MEVYFATNAKMVLMNDDGVCIIADIVLDVDLQLKKSNHPSTSRQIVLYD